MREGLSLYLPRPLRVAYRRTFQYGSRKKVNDARSGAFPDFLSRKGTARAKPPHAARGYLPPLALVLAGAFPAFGQTTHDLQGTTVTIAPTSEPGAVAQIEMHNVNNNDSRDEYTFSLSLGGISVDVTFDWDAQGQNDSITIETEPGYVAVPRTLYVEENGFGVLHIYPTESFGF